MTEPQVTHFVGDDCPDGHLNDPRMTGESITFDGRTWVPADALDKAEQRIAEFERNNDRDARIWNATNAAKDARLALAERLAEAVERHIGEDLGGDEDLIDALSAFRESEKKG